MKFSLGKLLHFLPIKILYNSCKRHHQRTSSLWPFSFSKKWYPPFKIMLIHHFFCFQGVWEGGLGRKRKGVGDTSFPECQYKAQTTLKSHLWSWQFSCSDSYTEGTDFFLWLFLPLQHSVYFTSLCDWTFFSNVICKWQVPPNYSCVTKMNSTIK